MSASKKIKDLKKHLETSLKQVIRQVDHAEKSAKALKTSLIQNLDKDKAQEQLLKFVAKSRAEIDALRSKIEKQVETLKVQAKTIAESERAKRRARRGSK
jgi:hypothetical protein